MFKEGSIRKKEATTEKEKKVFCSICGDLHKVKSSVVAHKNTFVCKKCSKGNH